MKKIIFHLPWELAEIQSASQLRPPQMISSFRKLGYEVEIISGGILERKKKFKEIKQNIKKGDNYSFCYSESSTAPTIFASGKKNFFSSPFIDYMILHFLSRKKIPIGLFIRDIHWKFKIFRPKYGGAFRWLVYVIAYYFDAIVYRLFVNIIFVPSVGMVKYLPGILKKSSVIELPPGIEKRKKGTAVRNINKPLRFIYVGGIGVLYHLEKVFSAAAQVPSSNFVFCFREREWEKEKAVYSYKKNNIVIQHKSNYELSELFDESDIGLLCVEPNDYWNFAMPFKLFEYLSYGKPIIATKGTAVAEFVTKWNVGWVVEYNEAALVEIFTELTLDRQKIISCCENIQFVVDSNTWLDRAKCVEEKILG